VLLLGFFLFYFKRDKRTNKDRKKNKRKLLAVVKL